MLSGEIQILPIHKTYKDYNNTLDYYNNNAKSYFDATINAISTSAWTTAKEASETISGSLASTKSAWKNLLTGIADENQDFNKLVDNFVDSIIASADNIVPRVKKIVEGIKKLVNSIIKDVFPKLKKEIPELRPLIETFEWFIDNKSKVTNAVKLMIGAFAITKITNFTKSMTGLNAFIVELTANMFKSKTATDLDTISQGANATAKGVATGATNLLTTAQKGLNAAWSANPIGLVITAVVALVTIYNKLTEKSKEVVEAEQEALEKVKEQTSVVKENKEAWDDLVESKQNTIDAGMTELTHYENLYDELEGIVDANGKVKEGYEQRASFIVGQLNEALGTEIEMSGNIIKNYDNLASSIDKVMEKKKIVKKSPRGF